jgi:hypothetical protein
MAGQQLGLHDVVEIRVRLCPSGERRLRGRIGIFVVFEKRREGLVGVVLLRDGLFGGRGPSAHVLAARAGRCWLGPRLHGAEHTGRASWQRRTLGCCNSDCLRRWPGALLWAPGAGCRCCNSGTKLYQESSYILGGGRWSGQRALVLMSACTQHNNKRHAQQPDQARRWWAGNQWPGTPPARRSSGGAHPFWGEWWGLAHEPGGENRTPSPVGGFSSFLTWMHPKKSELCWGLEGS